MENWLGITADEMLLLDEFIEKSNMDDMEQSSVCATTYNSRKGRENSWVRKDRFRKKLKKRFLSVKPDMTSEECYPLSTTSGAIYINNETAFDGGCYCLNHVNHLYMTKRGHVEQYRGRVEWYTDGMVYGIEPKYHDAAKTTNRRIRHEKIDADAQVLRYSVYKKKYAPKLPDVL